MLALEQPDSEAKVLNSENIQRFKYLPNATSKVNPKGLPVGFAVDRGDENNSNLMCGTFGRLCASGTLGKDWLGFNCAACHTDDIAYRDRNGALRTLRIDGAPTLADFQGFLEQLLASLKQTRSDNGKFDRFAKQVLGASAPAETRQQLAAELDEVIAWQQLLHDKNGAVVRYGFGRLDAQGHILNKVSLIVGAENQLTDFPSDAPASYPHIWNAPQHTKVQWNGIAPNNRDFNLNGHDINLGALGRNTGEVLGVFAFLDVSQPRLIAGFRSSLRLANMVKIERQLAKLRSPQWPKDLIGPLDANLAKQGKKIFDAKCLGCHAPVLQAGDVTTKFVPKMVSLAEIGTDLWLACNTYLHRSKSGVLAGTGLLFGHVFGEEDKSKEMLTRLASGAIIADFGDLAKQALDDLFTVPTLPVPSESFLTASKGLVEVLPGIPDGIKKQRAETCLRDSSRSNFENLGLAYKGRPLNGIWATAPYLHNGSVPTLYDLLLPASVSNTKSLVETDAAPRQTDGQFRPEVFCVGSREFDSKKVGFKSDRPDQQNCAPGTFEFRVRDSNNTPILGNYNSGHNYGTDLDETSRWALVEYLKGL